ncbi:MAG: preprotein translocase subunit SecG [Catonella sp.]|uniref:preprotein translocase subunit SecG n=1 Tax=Catonella sp. TaxID=2382125 RepID=UPI003F9F684C
MSTLRIVVTVIYCIICVALAAIVLLQEGKQQGLGTISGMADTYWGKNKSRSMEGNLNKATTIVALGFIVLSFVLNMKW